MLDISNFVGGDMGTYKSEAERAKSLELYNKQLLKLDMPFTDIYIETSFGKTHLIEIENKDRSPLLVFHGGNSTTAYNLLMCRFLLTDFHVYAVDTIGHPGKSAEVSLSHKGYDYGKWAGEVISGLGHEKMLCFGGSFGGGILAKLMCVAPELVEKAVLIVPAGINNALPILSLKMMLPLVLYRITKKEKYLMKTVLHMALHEDVIDKDTLDIVKDSFDNVKTKVGMPTNVDPGRLSQCTSPTLVIAGEKDCLFPAKKVLSKAKKVIPDCKTYLLKDSGHMHILPRNVQEIIVSFLKQ